MLGTEKMGNNGGFIRYITVCFICLLIYVTGIYKGFENAKISSHSILENGLRITKFDNNVSVYTNYTADTLYIDEQPVGAGEYLFVKE